MKSDLISLNDVVRLVQERLGVDTSAASLYRYIKTKNFPNNIGVGRPRRWNRRAVEEWCDIQKSTGRPV